MEKENGNYYLGFGIINTSYLWFLTSVGHNQCRSRVSGCHYQWGFGDSCLGCMRVKALESLRGSEM